MYKSRYVTTASSFTPPAAKHHVLLALRQYLGMPTAVAYGTYVILGNRLVTPVKRQSMPGTPFMPSLDSVLMCCYDLLLKSHAIVPLQLHQRACTAPGQQGRTIQC